MRNRRCRIIQRLLHLGPEPSVVAVGVGGQAGGHAAFGGDAGQQDADRVGQGQADAVKGGGGFGFQGFVDGELMFEGSMLGVAVTRDPT